MPEKVSNVLKVIFVTAAVFIAFVVMIFGAIAMQTFESPAPNTTYQCTSDTVLQPDGSCTPQE